MFLNISSYKYGLRKLDIFYVAFSLFTILTPIVTLYICNFNAFRQSASSRFYIIIGMYTKMTAIFWFSRGSNSLMLTSVSFIVINSMRVVKEPDVDKFSELLWNSDTCNKDSRDSISSGLISELAPCLNSEPMRIRCRVSFTRAIYIFFSLLKQAKFVSLINFLAFRVLISGWMKYTLIMWMLAIDYLLFVMTGCCCPFSRSGEEE